MDAQKESQKPLEAQVSLLYAFSDVLHNASAPVKHASSYRMVIKRALPDVFKALGESLKHCGVIAKPPFMTRVLRVCKAWREWYAFDVSFCDELEETFLGDKVVQ
jgi:U2-associated protein SR140